MRMVQSVLACEPRNLSFSQPRLCWREFSLLPLPLGLRRTETVVLGHGSLFAALTTEPAGIRFVGELGINNSFAFAQSLQGALRAQPRVHVDLSAVTFRDPEGLRVVMKSVRKLSSGHRILLHGLPASLVTVIRATGWIEVPGLAICDCRLAVRVSESSL